jgi:glycerol-3-phosphate cytidylyltransferase
MRAYDLSTYGGRVIYCFDIDGTVCSLTKNSNYQNAVVFNKMLDKINQLHDDGNVIYFMTARGSVSGIDWSKFTKKQLDDWGFKYDKLIMNKKPHAHYFIDDKGYNVKEWSRKNIKGPRGVVAGAFDVIHPGYIAMLREASMDCSHLTVCLHKDPTGNNKMKPVLTVEERKMILEELRSVDEVLVYETEEDLKNILKKNKYDTRILGDDYRSRKITGPELTKEIMYVSRDHGWSATKYKKIIYENYRNSN